MADDMFSVMKKKKKKAPKKEVDENVDDPPVEVLDVPIEEPVVDAPIDDTFDDFANLKKKKKKKPTAVETVENVEEILAEPLPRQDSTEEVTAPVDEFEDFANLKKKKKKKRADMADFEAQLKADGFESTDQAFDNVEGDAGASGEADAWAGSSRDLTYQELLSRVFKILRHNNPELAGEKKRYTIVPPSVHREGSKKTVFANLVDICKRMHRQPDHVIQYLFSELGTSGSIDGNQRLVIKGRFQQKQIENVLKRYIVEYVTCKTCKSADTILTKENRLFFLQCESCGSTRTVSAIKTGFQALTGKRAATRTG